jgi:hypothetical protein
VVVVVVVVVVLVADEVDDDDVTVVELVELSVLEVLVRLAVVTTNEGTSDNEVVESVFNAVFWWIVVPENVEVGSWSLLLIWMVSDVGLASVSDVSLIADAEEDELDGESVEVIVESAGDLDALVWDSSMLENSVSEVVSIDSVSVERSGIVVSYTTLLDVIERGCRHMI